MFFNYNSWDENFKKPFGSVASNTAITFNVQSDADKIIIHGFDKEYEMKKSGDSFTIDILPTIDFGLIFYTFEVMYSGKITYFGKCQDSAKACENGTPYQLTIHSNSKTPEWFNGKIMYQIYIDRFFYAPSDETRLRPNVLMHTSWNEKPVYIRDNNGKIALWDFFGGNLQGVIKKLDYLKDLGIDIIYLNPIFESSSNHKYDTADYNKIDMMYGNDATLQRLIDEANKLNMKIMLDGVFSHTGDDSIYFNKYGKYGYGGAYQNQNSMYYKWYNFKSYPDDYDCWWGVTSMPCVNELEPTFLNHLLNENSGAIIKWMKMGIAGWRLDVADELPDEFISKLKHEILKVNPKAVLLGEVWEDASNKVSYDDRRNYIVNDSLNSVSNYPLRDDLISLMNNKISAKDFAVNYMTLQENYPPNVFKSLMNMTGTHDSIRLFTLLGNAPHENNMNTWEKREYQLPDENIYDAINKTRLFYFAIYTLPGNPCIYYGDEICLEGYKDPYNRGTFDWNSKQKDIINLIKSLSNLRSELNLNNSHISMKESNGLLQYDIVVSSETKYKIYINASYDDYVIHWEDVNNEIFMLNAHKTNAQLVLNKFGAVVIKL